MHGLLYLHPSIYAYGLDTCLVDIFSNQWLLLSVNTSEKWHEWYFLFNVIGKYGIHSSHCISHIWFWSIKKKKIVTNANGKSICTILELHMTKTFFEKHTFCNEFTITFLKFENHINYKQACKNQISAWPTSIDLVLNQLDLGYFSTYMT